MDAMIRRVRWVAKIRKYPKRREMLLEYMEQKSTDMLWFILQIASISSKNTDAFGVRVYSLLQKNMFIVSFTVNYSKWNVYASSTTNRASSAFHAGRLLLIHDRPLRAQGREASKHKHLKVCIV